MARKLCVEFLGAIYHVMDRGDRREEVFRDALNRLTNLVDSLGTTQYAYTDGGQLQSEDGPWANDALNYTYDTVGQLKTALAKEAGGISRTNEQLGYAYDPAVEQVSSY